VTKRGYASDVNEVAETQLERSGPSPTRKRPIRVAVLVGCGVVLLTCAAIFIGVTSITSDSVDLLIGSTFGWQISNCAAIVGGAAATVAVFTVQARRWWLILAIPARIIAGAVLILGLLLPFFMESRVTPILVNGCPSGYLAIEPHRGSSWNSIGVLDGIYIRTVETFFADDFGRPFQAGAYRTDQHGKVIDVAYDGGGADPAFTLPTISSACSGH